MRSWETLQPDVYKLMTKHYTAGRGGQRINKIVIHHNGGSLTMDQIWQVWQTRQASAHYQVDTAGRIGQLVNDQDTAWHAGDWDTNTTSIGIEHSQIPGTGATGPVSSKTLEEGAHLVAALCKAYGLGRPQWWRNVFPHSHFSHTQCPGHLHPNGSQGKLYVSRAQHWFDVMTGSSPTPQTGAAAATTKAETPTTEQPTDEETEMKNSAIYCEHNKTFHYLAFCTNSGWQHEWTNGVGKGPLSGAYNNPIAATLGTGSFAKVSWSHFNAIKRSLADLRAGKVEVSGTVTIEGADQ